MRNKITTQVFIFLKKETVLCIAALLAVISSFFIPPSAEYFGYIDFRVLALLFCLMLVVAGFQSIGFFRYLADRLLSGVKSTRSLCLLLVALCFFSSMLITNDVALITFVPFAVMLLTMANRSELLIPVVVLQTIAANLGSMLTPVGNPQNLYLYSAYGVSMGTFLRYMLPLTLLSAALLLICVFLLPNQKLSGIHPTASISSQAPDTKDLTSASNTENLIRRPKPIKLLAYLALFAVCLLCVLRLLPWPVMLLFLIMAVCFLDKRLFRSVDYFLLLTFVCFFLFTGNIERIPAVSSFLRSLIEGRELLLGAALSQCISNVPAALLLSGFTTEVRPLLYGVNIGGLGTLIASLASVISYRLYGNSKDAQKGTYMKVFTLYNVIFFLVLYGAARLLLG
ncbi:MAG: SLC13 family permease [Acetatifactor sp.]